MVFQWPSVNDIISCCQFPVSNVIIFLSWEADAERKGTREKNLVYGGLQRQESPNPTSKASTCTLSCNFELDARKGVECHLPLILLLNVDQHQAW